MPDQISDLNKFLDVQKSLTPYIVGIGTSAGGLEALQSLFDNIPESDNIAYVIVQHLAPDYKSLMVELLSKHTKMKVNQIHDGMEIEANSVYVMPPKTNLVINKGQLFLKQKDPLLSLNFPIDIFFHSLGEDQGEKAIGIILSGTGTDGTRGIRTIKECGGIVMVQDPNTAKFNGMPLSAISTRLADFVSSPPKLAKNISQTTHDLPDSDDSRSQIENFDAEFFEKIVKLIKLRTNIDFSLYKRSTIFRRIERRMKLGNFESIKEYYDVLLNDKHEVYTLQEDLLIGVTKFFRDSEAFEIIEKTVIPEIFKGKIETDHIRIWIPGCSTGEEVYSLLMLLEEYKEKYKIKNPVKIFATDIDSRAIDVASNGIYPVNISADVKKNYLYKYFVQKDQAFHINHSLRNQIVFAKHNIFGDPPFNRVDLIVCRNLMIYLENALQDKIMAIFQFSLKKNGFLFLGPSESTGNFSKALEPVNKRWKIFKHISDPQSVMPDMLAKHRTINYPSNGLSNYSKNKGFINHGHQPYLIDLFKDFLVEEYVPKSVFVNQDFEVLYLAGGISNFMKLPEKALTLNFLKMVPKDLEIPISTAIRKSIKTEEPVIYQNLQSKQDEVSQFSGDLRVIPKTDPKSNEKILLVSFLEHDLKDSDSEINTYELNEAVGDRINYLEQQLKDTRENLQATIEELETSNEELQASNEELMAANEELQSTNEELQSVNEELHSVNSEFQEKILDLSELTNDMDNLMKVSEIGTIFLDADMRIRKFTPAIQEHFDLLPQDIGRPISHFHTDFGIHDILGKARTVLEKGDIIEEDISLKNKGHYLVRILPYKADEKIIQGVVITFVNINAVLERWKKE